MREIIFRGKQKDNGVFIEGDLIQISEGRKFIIDNKFGACIDDKGNFINTEAPFVCEVLPETVGQYTGSTDKNGVKIFEGDIVRAITHSTDIYVEAVTFKNGAFWYKNWSWVKFGFKFEKAEVIGNIHDNPELLGEPMKPASKNVAQSGLAPATENFELLEG